MSTRVAGNTSNRQPESYGQRERWLVDSTSHKRLAPKAGDLCSNVVPGESFKTVAFKDGVGNKSKEQQPKPSEFPKFEFINTTNNVQYSGPGSRSVARSHVMRQFHRHKSRSKIQQPNIQPTKSSKDSFCTLYTQTGELPFPRSTAPFAFDHRARFLRLKGTISRESYRSDNSHADTIQDPEGTQEEIYSWANPHGRWLRKHLRPNTPISPISSLWGLAIDHHAYELIYHHIQIFAKTFIPMSQNSECEWFRQALTDPACYHGTLFLSSAHKALLTGYEKSLPLEIYCHKGEVIRIVNQRLNDPMKGLKDGTIAAIACLAAFEIIIGTSFEAAVHVNGLQRLINMRGGPRKLGMDGFLEQFLYWVDLSNASAERKKPHFIPFESTEPTSIQSENETLWKYCNEQWDESLFGILEFKSFQGLELVESRLFHRLRQVSNLLSRNPSILNGSLQQRYTNAILILERQIGVAVQEAIQPKQKFGEQLYSPQRCNFYIPALVYCYMILRSTPVRSSIYDHFVIRMKTQLSNLTRTRLWGRFSLEFWLWSLTFVGAASIGRPEEPYFQSMTSILCSFLKLRKWEQAKAILREFAWVDAACERPCKKFWDTLNIED